MSKLICPHFTACSGCSHLLNAVWPPFIEQIPFPLHLISEYLTKWRLRSKLAIRGTHKEPLIGLFRKNSHEVVAIPHCLVHHPLINKAVLDLKSAIQKSAIAPYNERTGILRYAQFDVVENRVIVALVVNTHTIDTQLQNLVDLLVEKGGYAVWINYNTRSDNVIFSEKWQRLSGPTHFLRTIAETPIAFTPASFVQANPALFSHLVASLRDELRPQAKIIEFYAGSGSASLPLLTKASSLIAIEQNPHTEELFYRALKDKEKARYITGDVASGLLYLEAADTIIVDPPRKGLDKKLLQALKNTGGKELFYISCGSQSFLKDYEELIASGWQLKKARAYLLFPGSDHIELLVSFSKLC